MAKTMIDQLTDTPEKLRLYRQEAAIQNFTEMVCELMEKDDVSRDDLGKRLYLGPNLLGDLLDRGPKSLRYASDILHALGYTLDFTAARVDDA